MNAPLVARPFIIRTVAGIAAVALVLGGSLVGASAASAADSAPVLSDSAPAAVVVAAPAALATTTTLTAPATAVAGQPVTLSASVLPAAAVGSVAFLDGAAPLATVPVASGAASFEATFVAAASHSITAVFTPADAAAYTASASAAALVAVSAPESAKLGSLTWGVKKSFREYVVGPIARGEITTTGVTRAGEEFVFAPASGGNYTRTTGTGTAEYTGSVRFTGHEGVLDVTLSNPVVRVDSATSGTLLVGYGGEQVEFATLNLAGTQSSTASTVTYTAAPATLTAAGVPVFALNGNGFYPAGTALDPVTVVIEAAAPAVPAIPTATTLTASPAAITVGASTTLTAQVSPAAPGAFVFRAGTTELGSVAASATGSASHPVAGLPVGTQALTVEFVPTDSTRFAGSTASATVTVNAAPVVTPPVVEPVVGAGSLTWGVKQSFREYVAGPIARGAITTSGVSTSGGAFVFSQASGGTFDRAAGTGTSAYSGSVRFTGHAGVLDVTLSNPVVRVDSASSGTLLVTTGGSQVAFASLNLAAGALSTPNGTVSYSGVPASLTSQGVATFALNGSGFYPAGTALDPVSFVIGAVGASSGPGAATVASFAALTNTPAATPPATTGLTITPGASVTEGDEVTISGTGFQPNEKGILVVVYSDPVVLTSSLVADATGAASWTGRLPEGLTGTHTLTMQGSVDRGVEITIAAKAQTTALVGCVVDDATLTWGFKESFRSYISGTIANGEWTVADGATYATPNFGFTGAGSYDAETSEGDLAFPGSITFTGHAGILNTTVSNPQLRIVDETSAVLVLDVAGTTQDGAAINRTAVEFGRVDLSGAIVDDNGSVTITDAPAVLTAAGADAFGTYPEGEVLDPISAAFSIAADCTLPMASAGTPIAATADKPSEVAAANDSGDLGWILWAALALVLVAAIVVVVLVLRRRAVKN